MPPSSQPTPRRNQSFSASAKEGKRLSSIINWDCNCPICLSSADWLIILKVIQRENIGSWKERVDLERELNNWIRQYVVDMENPQPGVRSRRPLRQAQVTVEDVEGEPGWYRVCLKVRPHFKYMGAYFTLSLVG